MLDANTKKACKDDPSIREIKIRNIEHAIEQAELMIKESKMSQEEITVSYTHLTLPTICSV